MRIAIFAMALGGLTGAAAAQDIDPARVDAVIAEAFAAAPEEWQPRLVPDETMALCNASRNLPDGETADRIMAAAQESIVYPENGLMGDWQKGETLAQSGYGMRFTDYPPARENGGNCYACHQITAAEVSYGTIGPSLLGYGKLRDFSEEAVKTTYDRIYNPHSQLACSMMPRFGPNEVLTVEQIRDIVALLMDPESPVNQ
jgi:L-cysteine S-thiosulfotransferase